MKSRQERWLEAKEAERVAVNLRREVEDEMLIEFEFDHGHEGTITHEIVDEAGMVYEVKIVGRMNRKVNGDELQDLARESGLETYLQSLFRWSAEVSLSSWKATDKSITDKLAPAITTTPGRPSFSIKPIEPEKAKE